MRQMRWLCEAKEGRLFACEVPNQRVSACDVEGGLSSQLSTRTSCICNLTVRNWSTFSRPWARTLEPREKRTQKNAVLIDR